MSNYFINEKIIQSMKLGVDLFLIKQFYGILIRTKNWGLSKQILLDSFSKNYLKCSMKLTTIFS